MSCKREPWAIGRSFLRYGAATLVLLCFGQASWAQEILPREFVPAPSGTNLNLVYYIHGSNNGYSTTSGRRVANSNLDVNLGLERFVHYQTVGGMPAGVQAYQAFGSFADGRVGGTGLGHTFGAANTALSAFIWPYANPQAGQYLVFTGFLYPPVGSFDKNRPLNVAGAVSSWPGWTGDIQVGWDHAIGEHFSYDAALDGRFFGDITGPIQPGIPLSVRTHKRPDLRAQLWLNWAWNRAFTTSIGYQGFFGGNSDFDNPAALGGRGHTDVGASREQRIRAAASMFFSERFQTVLEVNHDVGRSGGFRQDFGLVLRALYIF